MPPFPTSVLKKPCSYRALVLKSFGPRPRSSLLSRTFLDTVPSTTPQPRLITLDRLRPSPFAPLLYTRRNALHTRPISNASFPFLSTKRPRCLLPAYFVENLAVFSNPYRSISLRWTTKTVLRLGFVSRRCCCYRRRRLHRYRYCLCIPTQNSKLGMDSFFDSLRSSAPPPRPSFSSSSSPPR